MNAEIHEEDVPRDRREREEVVRDEDYKRRTRVVEDVAAQQSAVADRISAFVWLLTGILEFLLGMRFILKLIGANPNAPFVSWVYSLTEIFLLPFFGITGTPSANGMVVEVGTLLAIFVYVVVGWVIARLVQLLLTPASSRSSTVEEYEEV